MGATYHMQYVLYKTDTMDTKEKWSSAFGIPMIWREQRNHYDECYFCMTNISGFNSKNNGSILYPNVSSVMKPIPRPPVSVEDDCYSDAGFHDTCTQGAGTMDEASLHK